MTEEDEGGADAVGENTTIFVLREKKKGTLGSTPVENLQVQSRERRRNDLIALQRGFQADKAKVLTMKASRKFKPV